MTTNVEAVGDRIRCGHCGSRFEPTVLKQLCPVCRTPAPGAMHHHHSVMDSDERMLYIVAIATLTNLLALGLLAALLLSH